MPSKKKTLLIKPCTKTTKENKDSVSLGKKLIDSAEEALVTYKNKTWSVKELLDFLAEEVKELKKNQCKPCCGCLFKYRNYAESTFVEKLPKDILND